MDVGEVEGSAAGAVAANPGKRAAPKSPQPGGGAAVAAVLEEAELIEAEAGTLAPRPVPPARYQSALIAGVSECTDPVAAKSGSCVFPDLPIP